MSNDLNQLFNFSQDNKILLFNQEPTFRRYISTFKKMSLLFLTFVLFPAGYYQPAGPLISVSHGGNTASSHGQPPPPAPLSKAASLSEASPTSTTPSVASTHDVPPPPPSSTGGDSSDSEVSLYLNSLSVYNNKNYVLFVGLNI